MSRNSSGVYTLPVAAFVAGTVIKSADINTDLSDIATALTQSLATTGVSTMTGALKLADGSYSSPSLTSGSDTTTGWYVSGTGSWAFTSSGTPIVVFSSSGITFVPNVTFAGSIIYTGSVTYTGSLTATSLNASTLSISAVAAIPSAPGASTYKIYLRDDLQYGVGGFADKLFAVDSSSTIMPLMFVGGQCRLILNGSNLELRPYNGNMLTIAGVPRQIFQYGGSYPSLAASNTASTFVYIYAYFVPISNTVALELSTTSYDSTTDTGVPIKSGDPTRTLVGAAYTDTGGAWADTAGKLWVISYFNRKTKKSRYTSSTALGVVTGATVTVSQEFTASFRNQFITWDDEVVKTTSMFYWNTSVASGVSYVYPRIDNGAVTGTLADTGPVPNIMFAGGGQNTIVAEVSNISVGVVHYYSPTYLSSACNINVLTTQTLSATSTNTFYTIVEIMG